MTDFLQNEYVLSAIKYALFPAIAALCGAAFSRFNRRKSILASLKMDVRKEQLEHIYTPLMRIVDEIPRGKARKEALQEKHKELRKTHPNLFDIDLLNFENKMDTHYLDYIEIYALTIT